MSEDFESMSVIQLRQAAKEMCVKLGAGINKQGIIEKLTEAAKQHQEELPPVQPAAHPIRSATLITDEEGEDDEDVPVLTPNPAARAIPRPAVRPAASVPTGAAAPATSSLSSISAKAPAFTMEGSRAWHNPRAYQAPAPNYQRTQPWGTRSPQQTQDNRTYTRAPQQRTESRPQAAPSYMPRFGPDQGAQEQHAPEYRQSTYTPAQDYAPRQEYRRDYVQPRDSASPAQGSYSPAPQQNNFSHPAGPSLPELLAAGDVGDGEGVLEIQPDGYGILRAEKYQPGKKDVYISNAQIRRFSLRPGDHIAGKTRPQRETDRYSAMLYITEINGRPAEDSQSRPVFDTFTPIYPRKRINLSGRSQDMALRLMDLFCPIGFGQRALITVSPKTDRAALLKKLAAAIGRNHLKAQVMVLLCDEKPEDVTEMREAVKAEVIATTFDEAPETQARTFDMALERAQRLVEEGKDAVVLLDNLTRMARTCNLMIPSSARTLAGGLAAGAMQRPKRFFGAARNTREAGSLTVIALAVSDSANALNSAILEELDGTANMALTTAEALAGSQALLPAFNPLQASTKRDDLLLSEKEMEIAGKVRAMLAAVSPEEAVSQLLSMMEKTENNEDFINKFDSWMSL